MDQKEKNTKDLLKQAKTLILSETDIPSGVKLVKRVIKLDPKNYWAYVYYGYAAKKKFSNKEALQSYDHATKISPDLVDGWKGVLSCLNSNNKEDPIFVNAYANLLRLEQNDNKWNDLFIKAKEVSNDLITILGLCVDEDYTSSNFKHRTSCRLISESVIKLEGVLYSRVILNAFKGYAFTADAFDRPEFCQKAVDYLIQTRCLEGLFDFFYYTLLQYGPKLYPIWFLSKVIVEISLYDIHKVEEILPCIENILSNENTLPISKKAYSIILFCKRDYSSAIEILEPMSYMGDRHSSLLLMKCLMKLMDFDTVLYLATCLSKTIIEGNSNSNLKQNFLQCVVEALAHSNDSLFLRLAIKLGMKALEINGGNDYHLLFNLCHASIGLKSTKFFYYLNKLQQYSKSSDIDYLNSLWTNNILENDDNLLQFLHKGAAKLMDGNMKALIREYSHALKLCDKNFIFHTVLGVNYEALGDMERAVNCYDTVLSLRSHDSTALRLLCNILLKNENEEDAINILENCCSGLFIKWHLTAEKVSATAGLLRYVKNDYHKALHNFSHALKLNPGSWEYLEMIAETYLCMNRFLSAENIYIKILSSDLNNLHVMLSNAYAMKLNINYASYFNNTIHCINSVIPTKHCLSDFKNIVKLLIADFVFIYRCRYSQSVDLLVNLSFSKYLNRLLVLYYQTDENKSDTVNSQEYLIAIYCFLESHFIAAEKYERRREVMLAHDLLQFCINGICKALEVYGSSFIAFWKLLGDVFLKCSSLEKKCVVPSWLFFNSEENPSLLRTSSVTAVQQINLAIKCFTVGLHLITSQNPDRKHEFYYDIAISFLALANHPDIISAQLRYYYLKLALRSAGASFINYDGKIANLWIFFNLIGVISSMMGSSNNFFKGLFDSFSVEFKEDFLINNKASFLLKEAMFTEAQELYEMCKLQGDGDYSSPWIGHFLTLLLMDTKHINTKLQFLLKIQGNHKLLQWLYGITLFQKQCYLLEKGERSTLQKVFKELQYETNVSRLTLFGYVKEIMGDIGSARKAYIKALRFAKYNVDTKTYDVLLNNAIRLCGKCNLGTDLLQHFNHPENQATALIWFRLCHINRSTFDENVFNTISSANDFNDTFQNKQCIQSILSTILCFIKPHSNLEESGLSSLPNVSEIVCKNIFILSKCSKSFIKRIISSLPLEKQEILLRTLENLLCVMKGSNSNVRWLIPQELSFQGLNYSLWQAESLIAVNRCHYDLTFQEVPAKPVTVFSPIKPDSSVSGFNNYPYSVVLQTLRNSMYPHPPSIQERFSRREQKIIDSQLNEKKKREEANSIVYSASALLPRSLKFNQSITLTTGSWDYETHGCHKSCLYLLNRLFFSMKSKNYKIAAKYLVLCLNILCQRCFNKSELIPLISFLSAHLKNLKLLQKALHLYPNEKILWKTLILFGQNKHNIT